MDRHPGEAAEPVSPQAFELAMQETTRQMLHDVMQAVNQAPDGRWINGSEMQVRDLLGEYRRRVFESALQMKANAAEGAFSPDGPNDRSASEEQGDRRPQHPDRQRPGEPASAAVAASRRRRRGRPRRSTSGPGRGDGVPRHPSVVLPTQRDRQELSPNGREPQASGAADDQRRIAAETGRNRGQAGSASERVGNAQTAMEGGRLPRSDARGEGRFAGLSGCRRLHGTSADRRREGGPASQGAGGKA